MRRVNRRRAALFIFGACALASTRRAGAAQPLDINTASLAQIEALSGVGTALAARVIEERAKRPFADWPDAQKRVKGLGPKLAAQLSEQGLTVNGVAYGPAQR
jgi:competence protein ComEA